MEQELKHFSSEEAARILGVNVSSIKRWTEMGVLECVKTAGGHRKFTIQHLAHYLKTHESKTNKANLFPIESDSDLELSYRIFKRDFAYLIDYVLEQSLRCNRERVQRVFNGCYLGQYPLHEIYDDLITPIMHRNGDMWERGEISVTEEHFSTQTIRDCMVRLQGTIVTPGRKGTTAFCLTMSQELHDVAMKMVDHILELKGYTILCSGQMTPSLKIEKIFEIYHPDRVFISSTFVPDLTLAQAEFDKICYVAAAHNALVYVGGRGFDAIDFSHPAVAKRLYNMTDAFLH